MLVNLVQYFTTSSYLNCFLNKYPKLIGSTLFDTSVTAYDVDSNLNVILGGTMKDANINKIDDNNYPFIVLYDSSGSISWSKVYSYSDYQPSLLAFSPN